MLFLKDVFFGHALVTNAADSSGIGSRGISKVLKSSPISTISDRVHAFFL